MNERVDIIRKDNLNARTAAPRAKPERERFGARFETRNNLRVTAEPDPHGGAPRGSVDRCALNYVDMTDWERGTRIMDVVATVDSAVALVLEVIREAFAERLWALEDKSDAIGKRLTMAELESAALKSENTSLKRDIAALAELRDEVSGLTRQVKLARAERAPAMGDSCRGRSCDPDLAKKLLRSASGPRNWPPSRDARPTRRLEAVLMREDQTVNGTLAPNNDVRPDTSILSLVGRVGNNLPLRAVAASPSEEHKRMPEQ
jgi:hypothetical protein